MTNYYVKACDETNHQWVAGGRHFKSRREALAYLNLLTKIASTNHQVKYFLETT